MLTAAGLASPVQGNPAPAGTADTGAGDTVNKRAR